MAINLDKYNQEVKAWDQESNAGIKALGAAKGIVHRSDSPSPSSSLNKFKSKTFTQDGAVVKISKTFPRTLIYTHKGAGKGRGGSQGSRWTDKYGNKKTTNLKSFGKMGTGGRVAKPFINDYLDSDKGVDKLATIAAEQLGDVLVGSLLVK